jgi:Mrp family chromosome partitioning ATPase
MTIMEALEKAKRMHQERTLRDADQTSARQPVAMPVLVADVEPVASVRLETVQLAIDQQRCEENRILIAPAKEQTYSAISDAYRILRTRLLHRIASERWNSLAITSAGPGEGKSVTSLNLALAMALEKKRNIVLLDLDLRKPSLCRYLGVKPKVEVGSYLTGGASPGDILFNIGIDNLILAGGLTSYEHSSELLGGALLLQLLTHIHRIDPHALVLVDLPPLLSTADALVVAPKLSATLLVVAEGVTQRDGFARAIEVLSGVTVAGIVLNHARESVGNYYG